MERTIVGIDVGTTKVCTLIGEIDDADNLCIVGVGVSPSHGLSKGVVVNVDEASKSIADSIEKAERVSGYTIESCYVGLAGKHISSTNSRGVVAVGRGERRITEEDAERALEAAQAIAVPHNREIVHVIPRSYTLDGVAGVRDPVGMVGFRLEVEAHIVTGAVASIRNLVQCIENADVEVNDLILQPLASGQAVLTPEERQTGVVLVDAGGGTTDVAIFVDGSIWHSVVLPVGGNNLTNDLSVGLRTPFATAEELKIKYGHVLPELVDPDDMVEVRAFGEGESQSVSRRQMAEVLEARAEEMFAMIVNEMKRSGYEGLLPAGLVLTGGTAELQGFKELGREMLQLPVRVGRVGNISGLLDAVSSPAYATAVGLLLWGLRHGTSERRAQKRRSRWADLYQRFTDILRAFLPH
ncbi:MAG: cell division protein FtsA [Anaerolineae bacterium SM23_84]|nr:MAG: cell division protein FtsA [Anaerolineae bacterium SM23_84]